VITDGARFRREIKSEVAIAKAGFNKKNTRFTSKLDINLSLVGV
jgi:hypothetical protein